MGLNLADMNEEQLQTFYKLSNTAQVIIIFKASVNFLFIYKILLATTCGYNLFLIVHLVRHNMYFVVLARAVINSVAMQK